MTKHLRLFLIACVATTVFAQGRGGPVNVEAPGQFKVSAAEHLLGQL